MTCYSRYYAVYMTADTVRKKSDPDHFTVTPVTVIVAINHACDEIIFNTGPIFAKVPT